MIGTGFGIRTAFGTDVPVMPGRDAARDAAGDELSKPIYEDAQPSLLVRGIRRVLDWLDRLLDRVSDATPGGWWGLLLLLAVLMIAGYAIRRGIGPVRRAAATADTIFDSPRRSAAEHRQAADEARERGDVRAAVRERFRAVVRTLEERGLIDERPGRTADEAAADGGQVLPELGARLRTGARIFDEIVYGEHRADAGQDDELRSLDGAVRSQRPTSGSVTSGAVTSTTVAGTS